MNYHEERNNNYKEKLKKVIDSLPCVCRCFIKGIADSTSVRTQLGYASDLKLFFTYLATVNSYFNKPNNEFKFEDLELLTVHDIREYMEWLDDFTLDGKQHVNRENAKARKLSSLRAFFEFNVKNGYMTSSPAQAIESVKIHKKKIIRLTKHEQQEFLNAIEKGIGLSEHQKAYYEKNKLRDYAVVCTFLYTGMRIAELTAINIADVDMRECKFDIVRKGGDEDTVYFSDRLKDIINDYIVLYRKIYAKDEENALFITTSGKRMSVRAIENMVLKYAKIAIPMKKITPHKLRSTYGTALYDATHDILMVSEALGHKSIEVAKARYVDTSDENKKNIRNLI